MDIPVRLSVSARGGFNFSLLDPEQDRDNITHDMCDEMHEEFMDALAYEADQRGAGTHVLTVRL